MWRNDITHKTMAFSWCLSGLALMAFEFLELCSISTSEVVEAFFNLYFWIHTIWLTLLWVTLNPFPSHFNLFAMQNWRILNWRNNIIWLLYYKYNYLYYQTSINLQWFHVSQIFSVNVQYAVCFQDSILKNKNKHQYIMGRIIFVYI